MTKLIDAKTYDDFLDSATHAVFSVFGLSLADNLELAEEVNDFLYSKFYHLREAPFSAYDKWKNKTQAELEQAVANREVSWEYLNWLGITGKGAKIRSIVAEERSCP